MGAKLALVFQLQCSVVEHIDGVFFLLGVPFLNHRGGRTLWWKLLLCTALLWALMIAGRELNLPAVTDADTPSLHGLLYISPLARLLEFLAGMTTCAAFRWAGPKLSAVRASIFTALEVGALFLVVAWVLTLPVLMGLAIRLLPSTADQYLGHTYAFPSIIPVLFIFAFQRGAISRVLSLKPLLLLGEASYSLYLVHQMTFAVVAN